MVAISLREAGIIVPWTGSGAAWPARRTAPCSAGTARRRVVRRLAVARPSRRIACYYEDDAAIGEGRARFARFIAER
jgi:hypothetical protein